MNNLERLAFYYLAGRIWRPNPRFLIYNATWRCDLLCRHCGIWEAKKKEELSPAQLERIINRKFFKKIDTVWLTGGEPTLRQDLKELAIVFRKNLPTMRILGIASNGYATERIISRIEEILMELNPAQHGIFLHLSLDGIGEVFDQIRGKLGAFARLQETVSAFHLLKQKFSHWKIELGFNCVIQKRNAHQLKEIKKFAESHRASLTFNMVAITDQYFCNQARAKELELGEAEKASVIQFLDELIVESRPALRNQYQTIRAVLSGGKRGRRCLSLYSTFIIDADGSWIPCPLCSGWVQENFLNTDPEKFWKSKLARALRKKAECELCPNCMLSCSLGDSLSVGEFLAGGF